MRKQYLKLLVLVKWAENAKDIQMCQVCEYTFPSYLLSILIDVFYTEYHGLFS